MSNKEQTQAQAQPKTLIQESKEAGVSAIRMVNNVFRLGEHTTGILADKAERFREQVHIQDTITHNQLIAELNQQAKDLGITI